MDKTHAQVKSKGKSILAEAISFEGFQIVVKGNRLRIAEVHDEDYLDGQVVDNPERFITGLRQSGLKADLFTFSQKPGDPATRYDYPFEWDNAAAIKTDSYEDWWNLRVSHNLRTDIKRSKKRGVVVKQVEFTDEFVHGIVDIYNETPVRQGRPFWHYQKDFQTIKDDTATYLSRSEFLGSYVENELIGFLKIVYVGKLGRLMQIISKVAHQDKRPTNAMIAKAVELCAARKCSHLTYGKYIYGKSANSLTDFKRRNGFEQILVPKYYIPLTLKGRAGFKLGLHHGLKNFIPEPLMTSLVRFRSLFYRKVGQSFKSRDKAAASSYT